MQLYRPEFGKYTYNDRPSTLVISNINSSCSTKEIIDSIYSNDCKTLLGCMSLLDFKKCQFYTYSNDTASPKKYKHYIMRDFMSPIVDMIRDNAENTFEMFKTTINYILSKVEFKYMEYILSERTLNDILHNLIPFLSLTNKNSCYDTFQKYFGYLSEIGLFNPNNGDYYLDLVYCMYAFFSEPEIMFSNNKKYKNIFRYILSIVPAFKMFFCKMPISTLLFDPEYIKMAYCYGLNIHCVYITKSLALDFWNSYNVDIFPQREILEFLYLSGRDAIKDLFRVELNARILLATLTPNEFSRFEDYIKLYESNEFKDSLISQELLLDSSVLQRSFEDHEHYKFNLNLTSSKTIQSINVILDFSRLSDKFPKSLRLSKSQLIKKYSTFSKDVADSVREILNPIMTENITGIILSY